MAMIVTLTHRFVQKICRVDYRQIPPTLIELSKHVILDGLAVMIAGASEPSGLGRIAKEYVRSQGGHPQASVITGGFKTSVTNAAYANGCLAHALDYDNTWYPLNHPTSPTLPVILALAQHLSLHGRKVIEAIVVAFEVQGRVRLAATGMSTGKGFHKPGMTGVMGATAAGIKLLGLSESEAIMAFGLAGSRAGSLSINTGTMTKSSHSGHAARMGAECALKAQMGWTAADDIFGPGGFFDSFWQGNAEPERLIQGFGEPWRMLDPGVGFKKYPSNYFTHRPIDAVFELRKLHAFDAKDVDAIKVYFPAAVTYVDRPEPATGLDGKFSVQYVIAIALLDDEVTIDSFTDKRRFSDDVDDLLRRIKVIPEKNIPSDFDKTYVEVEISLRDGRAFSTRMERLSGWCGNPLTDEERTAKFFQCVKGALSPSQANRLLVLVNQIDTLENIHELMNIVETEFSI